MKNIYVTKRRFCTSCFLIKLHHMKNIYVTKRRFCISLSILVCHHPNLSAVPQMAPGVTAGGATLGAGAAGATGAVLSRATGTAAGPSARRCCASTISSIWCYCCTSSISSIWCYHTINNICCWRHWQTQWGLVNWVLPPWSIGSVCEPPILLAPFLSCFFNKTNVETFNPSFSENHPKTRRYCTSFIL